MSISRNDFRLMLGSLAGVCISNFVIFSAPLYIGSLMDGMNFNEVQAGLINTVEIASIACTCLLLSQWVSLFSPRYLAMSGACITFTANLITFMLDQYEQLLIMRALAGMGAGLCLAAVSALLSRMSDPDRMMGIMMISSTAIMIVCLTLMGYAKAEWYFDGVNGIFSITVFLVFPLLLFVPTSPLAKGSTEKNSVGKDISNIGIGSLGVFLLFLFCTIEGCVWAFSERSGNKLGIDDGDIGLLLALAQVAGLLGGLIPAVLGERMPRIYPISIGVLLMGSAGMLIYQTSLPLIYAICLCSFSFGFYIAFPYLIGACARLDEHGRWASRATGINLLGGAVAPFIAASIIATNNYQSLGTFCMSLSLLCFIIGIFFSIRLDRIKLVEAI